MRVKGYPHRSKCFNDYETAYIWGKYWEMVTQEKDSFGARDKDMLTVLDVMLAKYETYDAREMKDCEEHFKNVDIWNTYISELNYETLMKHAHTMLNTPVSRGGSRGLTSGYTKLPEPMTVLRKFAYLSSAINHLIKQGADIDNHTVKVIAFLREMDKEKKNGKA